MRKLFCISIFITFLGFIDSVAMEIAQAPTEPEIAQEDESRPQSCGISSELTARVHENLPVCGYLEKTMGITQWPLYSEDDGEKTIEEKYNFTFKKLQNGNEIKDLKDFYRRFVRDYRGTYLELKKCTQQRISEIKDEEEQLAQNPIKTRARYILAGALQTLGGIGFLVLLGYDIYANINNFGNESASRETLFSKESIRGAVMRLSAYTALFGGSFLGLKGLSNLKNGINLEAELEQQRTNAEHNKACLGVFTQFAHDMRKANPNLKTPKNQRKKLKIDETKNQVK